MALLSVRDLAVSFVTRNGTTRAVDGISFDVEAGAITAIIGESGSGKSVACYSLLGLVPTPPGRIDSGSAIFQGSDLLALSEAELRALRGREIAMVFQDPMTSLNPFLTIGAQLEEPLRCHRGASRSAARARALELLAEVGIRDPARTIDAYPHEFSGGMRQRVMIAMALINEPRLLIADEPTTALDVTIQAQMLELIAGLQRRRGIGVLFISHDLAVVADIADHITVMERGRIVEQGNREAIFRHAGHPYTRKLLEAIPTGARPAASDRGEVLLELSRLCTWFPAGRGQAPVRAVDDVSFAVHRGEFVGLVGESGSGKSTLGRTIMRLVPATSGSVRFAGEEVLQLDGAALRRQRRRMQMIFQDPFASLNPRMTVFDTLAEPLLLHGLADRARVGSEVMRIMDDVGLPRTFVRKYPHEFSGGQRQRIAIGRALATRPEFVVADEPVSALDVTIQAQILQLLTVLGEEYGLTLLFISHDLSVVRQLVDRIVVLRHGAVVEAGDAAQVFEAPAAAYTRELLAAVPGQSLRD